MLKKVADFLSDNLVIILLALGILLSPHIVDPETLPKGYELPKVYFWQVLALVLIGVGFVNFLYKKLSARKFKINPDILIPLVFSLIFVVAALLSPFREIALEGNDFRFQGLYTHLVLIWLGFTVYKNANRKNFHFIALAFLASGIIQALLAFEQVYRFATTNPEAILAGYYINGSFGQSNFFSGRLLVAIIFAAYYLGRSMKSLWAFFAKVIIFLTIIVMIVAMIISQSIWAIIVAAIAMFVIIFYELLSVKNFLRFFVLLLLIALGGSIYFVANFSGYNIRFDIWKNILNITLLGDVNVKSFFFGYGFDTLGHVFSKFGIFEGLFVDRAHNFFLDVLVQTGLVGLTTALIIFGSLLNKARLSLQSRRFAFAFFAVFFWLVRSFVHESGIVNLVDFLIVLSFAFALSSPIKLLEPHYPRNDKQDEEFESEILEAVDSNALGEDSTPSEETV